MNFFEFVYKVLVLGFASLILFTLMSTMNVLVSSIVDVARSKFRNESEDLEEEEEYSEDISEKFSRGYYAELLNGSENLDVEVKHLPGVPCYFCDNRDAKEELLYHKHQKAQCVGSDAGPQFGFQPVYVHQFQSLNKRLEKQKEMLGFSEVNFK